jgi:hypothetical protein
MSDDAEKASVEVRYVSGYRSLTAFVASDGDKSTAIYRRFDQLSARTLLYLQSELVELEARRVELDQQDPCDRVEEKRGARDWKYFQAEAMNGGRREEERMKVVLQIRERLKEYRKSFRVNSISMGSGFQLTSLPRRSTLARGNSPLYAPAIQTIPSGIQEPLPPRRRRWRLVPYARPPQRFNLRRAQGSCGARAASR